MVRNWLTGPSRDLRTSLGHLLWPCASGSTFQCPSFARRARRARRARHHDPFDVNGDLSVKPHRTFMLEQAH